MLPRFRVICNRSEREKKIQEIVILPRQEITLSVLYLWITLIYHHGPTFISTRSDLILSQFDNLDPVFAQWALGERQSASISHKNSPGNLGRQARQARQQVRRGMGEIKSAKCLSGFYFYSLSRNRQRTVTTLAIVSQVGEGLYIVRGTLYK